MTAGSISRRRRHAHGADGHACPSPEPLASDVLCSLPPRAIMLRERWFTPAKACWLAAPCAMDSEVPVTLPATPAITASNTRRSGVPWPWMSFNALPGERPGSAQAASPWDRSPSLQGPQYRWVRQTRIPLRRLMKTGSQACGRRGLQEGRD
jgi:hypothetical protein